MRRKTEKDVVAILLADIHLSLQPPVWRSTERCWLDAQSRPLSEVKRLQAKYKCPIFCAGDVFDRWNSLPELVNYAIDNLPIMYAIPGQHDLPLHRVEDIHRSAFLTLMRAKKIYRLPADSSIIHEPFEIFSFPFGYTLKRPKHKSPGRQAIAIVHDYAWIERHGYVDAPVEKYVGPRGNEKDRKYYGYDIIVYGDNHDGFLTKVGKTTIFNCGTLIRRKADEANYKPQVGLLTKAGTIIPYYLDIIEDKCLNITEAKIQTGIDLSKVFWELEKLGKTALDFEEAMKQLLHKSNVAEHTKRIILQAMEKNGKAR